MVAVVIQFQLSVALIFCHAIYICQFGHACIKVLVQFGFCNSAYCRIPTVERYVRQIVKVAEYTYLAKLCYTCKKCKAYLGILGFQNRIKRLKFAPIDILQHIVAYSLQQWLVVFIDKYHYRPASLFESLVYHMQESFLGCPLAKFIAIYFFPLLQVSVQFCFQRRFILILPAVQIEMKYRIRLPFLFQLAYSQAIKQFRLPMEISFHSRYQQTFPEPARTR